ncbi:hypothetical protein GCM10022393_04860 [Aquimarina addita]|uniref:Uncharacterized protein n=1 Tax=Aquimarina addita TaxID=870485 RepID=A0ABP7X9U2_9FLAO
MIDILEKERTVQKNILEIFKENFHVSKTDDEILNINPEKEFGANSNLYYESISDIFLLEQEHQKKITGKVKHTIKKVAKLWETTPYSLSPM